LGIFYGLMAFRRFLTSHCNVIPSPIVQGALGPGIKERNLINLKWSEVNLSAQIITIDAEKMQNDEYRCNPLTDIAFETLLHTGFYCLAGFNFSSTKISFSI
jgi:hypothetical protein